MKAIVIGGGIGGASTVRSLLRHGIEATAYERASEFTEIGAGLQLAAPTVRILKGFGLGRELERLGVPSEATSLYDLRSDRMISHTPLGQSGVERYGEPFLQVHRPDLLNMLIDDLPSDALRLGMNATNFEQTHDGVRVEFESGETAEGDVLIGADGIHSYVRDQLLGEANPEFSNIVAWRALIPEEKARHIGLSRNCHVWIGPNRSGVVYYVHGSKLINFVGMVPESEITKESWTTRGDVNQLRQSFEGCTERLWQLIELIDDAFITGYYFRYPLPYWSNGRVTILGDAAHPMHPFLAQGACQAIEDGAVLAPLLAQSGSDVATALHEYENIRYPRASKVQNQSRSHEHLWHMTDPREIRQRNAIQATTMEIDPYGETVYGWLYRYDAEKEATARTQALNNPMKRPESQRAWDLWAYLLQPSDLGRRHHGIRDAYDRFQLENFAPDPNATIEHTRLANLACVVSKNQQSSKARPVILHFHGGGYLIGSAHAATGLTTRLATAVDGDVYAVEYRRAPENPFPAALEDGLAAYQELLQRGIPSTRIFLSGESSGGGLALAVAMQLTTLDTDQPAGLVLMSPMADLAVTGDSMDTTAGIDPVGLSLGPTTRILATQMAANYLQGHDPRDPLASPVHGSLHSVPPMLIQAAADEAFYSDAQRLYERARHDQVDARLSVYQDTVHVFPMFDFLPESDDAINEIARFVQTFIDRKPSDSRCVEL